jgi:hypothetical protein
MSTRIRRVVSLTALTAALFVAAAAPSHAAHQRGTGSHNPAPAASLMTQAWSWVERLLGTSTVHSSATLQKDTIPFPPPPPPGTPGGSGSMQDPDGHTK